MKNQPATTICPPACIALAARLRIACPARLPLLLLLLMLPAVAQAQDYTYTTNAGAITITGYHGSGGAVTIPSTITGLPVTSIGYRAFYANASLTNVTIGAGVTNIGLWALGGCPHLGTITADPLNPAYGSVAGVLFDKSQTTLVAYPGGQAGTYTIPSSVTNIGAGAFNGAIYPTGVAIPNSVTTIGDTAFSQCESVATAAIPDSVTSIGQGAFIQCDGLTNITIGAGVTNIGLGPFEYCFSLAVITVDAFNPAYSSVAGVLFDKSHATLIAYPLGSGAGTYTTYTVPSGVTNILAGAFLYSGYLTSVIIPSSVTSLGDEAFNSCDMLERVYFQGNAPSLGVNVFYYDPSAVAYYVAGTTNWGAMLGDLPTVVWDPLVPFNYTTNGGAITITGYIGYDGAATVPSKITGLPVTGIGYEAFWGSITLTNITIGDEVTSIGFSAFAACPSLAAITADPLNPAYSSMGGVLFNTSRATLVAYPEGNAAGTYTIPSSVTNIGAGAFSGSVNLTSVTIPNNVTRIEDYGFESCTSLTSVTIPDSVTSIGNSAFDNCSSLTNITIGNGVTSIGSWAFLNTKLTSATIGASVRSIGDHAFDYTGLTSVIIPRSVTYIGDYAFASCAILSGVYFLGDAPSLGGASVFLSDNIATLYYLPGTTNWGSQFGYRPTLLWNPQVQTSGPGFGVRTNRFGFNITGTSNLVIVVEACTSLAHPTWSPVRTNTLTGGASYFSDPHWTNYPARFYRIWNPMAVSPATAPWNAQVQTGDASFGVRTNQFGFTITGTSGLVVVVEACANLASPAWSPVRTNTLTGGSSYFSDPQWTDYPARLYRLRSP